MTSRGCFRTWLRRSAVTPQTELFASWSKNLHAHAAGADGPFSQTQAAFDLSKQYLKPETSTNIDLGLRARNGTVQGSVALYAADFKDRQLNVATCTGIVGCPTTLTNVGKVATRGIEAAVDWKLSSAWKLFNSFTFNRSEYKNAPLYYEGTAAIDVNGKRVVDAPRVLFNTELSFEQAGWFARLDAKYTGTRYYTYLNDSPVPSYWVANVSAGYKLGNAGPFRDATIQLNVANLFDRKYFATIGTNGFASADPAGTFATMLAGSPRAAFLSLSGKL